MSWVSFRLRMVVVIAAAASLGACEGKKKGSMGDSGKAVAAPASDEAYALVPSGHYVSVEATRKDRENIKENEPDCYVWPKTCSANVTGFVDGATEGEAVQAMHLDSGLYDIEVLFGPTGGDLPAQWRGKLVDVRVDSGGVTHDVTLTSPDGRQALVMAVRLQAESETRADGSICEDGNGGGVMTCSSDDQHYKCMVGAFAAYGCSKAEMYQALEGEICSAKLDMRQSEFAAGFTCSEIAASEVPQP